MIDKLYGNLYQKLLVNKFPITKFWTRPESKKSNISIDTY